MSIFGDLFGKKKSTPPSYESDDGYPAHDNFSGDNLGLGIPDRSQSSGYSDMDSQSSYDNYPSQDYGTFQQVDASADMSGVQVKDVRPAHSQNSNYNHAQTELREVKIEKNLEVISSKLDSLKIMMENFGHRLEKLENDIDKSKNPHLPSWKQ